MLSLKGIFSALLVSYNADGTLDEAGTRAIIRHNIDKVGIDGLYVGGSSGENFLVSTDVKKRIFEIAAEEAKGKVALVAQIGGLNIDESIELGLFVKKLGAYNAISAVTPFYYKYSFDEIKAYYNKLANTVDMDLIVYSIPFLTGVDLTLNNFAELFENKRIIGVKFTAANFYLLERLRLAFPNHLIFSGFDEMLLPAAIYQVDGAIGSTYNVIGKAMKELFAKAQAGDIPAALEIQHRANDFIEKVLENGLYQTLKECLHLCGVEGQLKVRSPMHQLTEAQKNRCPEILDTVKDLL